MTVRKEDIERALLDALDVETRPLFPAIYEDFTEVEALAQGEDKLLSIIKDIIYQYWQNRNLQTLTEQAAAVFETELGLSHSGTIEERRSRIAEAINRKFVLNDAALLALIQSLAGGETNEFDVDPKMLELWLKKATNTESSSEFEDLTTVRQTIEPIIPQNLAIKLKVEAATEKTIHATYCGISWLRTNIGHVERHIVGDHGFMSENGDIEYQSEHGFVDRPTGLYTNTLVERGPGEHGTIPMAQEIRGYLRGASYQTANKNLTANSSNYLYAQGENSFLAAETGKTYTLTGAYTNADASVDITGCSVAVSGGNVKLEWGATAAQVCYVTISII